MLSSGLLLKPEIYQTCIQNDMNSHDSTFKDISSIFLICSVFLANKSPSMSISICLSVSDTFQISNMPIAIYLHLC